MNIKRYARQFQTMRERNLAHHGPKAEKDLRDFIEDVRVLDNSEVDLDPRSDRVLFLQKNRFWQSKSKTKALEYSINPNGSLGVRETIGKGLNDTSDLLWMDDYTAISCEQREEFWLQRDSMTVSKSERTHRRNNGDPDLPRNTNDIGLVKSAIEDSLLAQSVLQENDRSILERLEKLEERIPAGGWEKPIPLWTGALSSKRDNRIDSMIETAHREHRRFGAQQIEEKTVGSWSTTKTKEKILKRGQTEEKRSVYKNVQKYWRSVGQNHSGLDRDKDWSEAFLSFLCKQADSSSPFRKDVDIDRLTGLALDKPVWGYDFEGHKYEPRGPKKSLKKGDFLVRQTAEGRQLDLVTKVDRDGIEVMAGDYNDSVVKRTVPLDSDGAPRDQERYPGFLRLK